MISLQITDVKDFMAKLLKTDLFDIFSCREAVITTSVTCHIGRHVKYFLFRDGRTRHPRTERTLDRAVFPVPADCFDLIKGSTPLLILNLYSCSLRKI